MPSGLMDRTARVDVPVSWPAALHPRALRTINQPTPYLVCDLATVRDRYRRFTQHLPGVRPFFAVKCNSSPEVLRTLAGLGSGFEVASMPELDMLRHQGVDPAEVLYSNTVKPPGHIAAAYAAGLWRFAVDAPGEVAKIARYAPGSAVYVRLRVNDSTSTFPLSRKFGAEAHRARSLFSQARDLGLRPYGVTFHVGSQCSSAAAWAGALTAVGQLIQQLLDDGIRLEMLDIGGGFPARYGDPVPTIEELAAVINPGLERLLPYVPPVLVAEPGRHLVAESAVMVASVLGREVRGGDNWLYLDVGAYNGLMETAQTLNMWRFPLWSSRADHALVPQIPFTVTGPSCDSSDTMFYGVDLPSTLEQDDRIYIGSAGAYTLSYASSFNGFAPPTTLFVGER